MINEFFNGVSLREIENFEEAFHIKFPEDYKIFLQTYNGADCSPHPKGWEVPNATLAPHKVIECLV